jgi:hypothetical protein
MTTQEALDRALEALREINKAQMTMLPRISGEVVIRGSEVFELQDIAADALYEIQRGLWIETVNRQVDLEEFCAARGISP